MKTIIEPEREIKVASQVDICVIGGSCTGVFGAVRAAKLGASVAIVEKQNCFGGTATSGMVNIWHSLRNVSGKEQIIAGLTNETIERLESKGGCQSEKPPVLQPGLPSQQAAKSGISILTNYGES